MGSASAAASLAARFRVLVRPVEVTRVCDFSGGIRKVATLRSPGCAVAAIVHREKNGKLDLASPHFPFRRLIARPGSAPHIARVGRKPIARQVLSRQIAQFRFRFATAQGHPGLLRHHLARPRRFCWIAAPELSAEARVVPFFVQIKCHLGKSYEVANKLADSEIASEIYSTAGDFDLLVKFYVEDSIDIGHFVTEKVQTIPGIQDTRTIITFRAFKAF